MTNNKVKLVAAVIAVLTASGASAQTPGGFEVGAELFDYNYRERVEGETIVRDDGLFGGLRLGYTETIGGGAFLRARLNVAFGSVDYSSNGAIIGEPTDTRLENVLQGIGYLELHAGKDFVLKGGTTITPYVGIGARYLSDNSGGEESEDGLLGYDRQVSYSYLPLGVAARVPIGGRTSLVLAGQYNLFLGGDAESKFSEIDPAFPDVELELNDGSGYELSALVSMPLGRNAISFGPFIRRWNIGESESFILEDPEGSGESIELVEPRNRTTEIGVRVSFSF